MYVSCMTLVFRNIKGRLNYMVRHITMSFGSLIAHNAMRKFYPPS